MSRAVSRRAVIFDLDNTLILEDEVTMAAVRASAEAVRESTGVDPERLASAAATLADRLWKQAPMYDASDALGIWWGEALWGTFAGEGDTLRAIRAFAPGFRAAVWRGALERAGSADRTAATEMERAYIRVRRSGELVDPDAEPVLADLARDHRLALLTNGAGDVQREKLSRTALARHFETLVISGEVGVGKPDPRIFDVALERLALERDEVTMVGDSIARDVAGAKHAGLRAVWIDRGGSREEGLAPDATIRRLSDLRAALDALERRPASPPARP